jgi:hypothetical protein
LQSGQIMRLFSRLASFACLQFEIRDFFSMPPLLPVLGTLPGSLPALSLSNGLQDALC